MELKVEVKDLPGKQVAYIRLNGGYKEIDYLGTWMRLLQFAKEQNIQPLSFSPICLYHDDPKVTEQDKLRTSVCLVLPRVRKPKGEVGVKEIPGGKYAIFRYQGPYENLHAVYDTIYAKWIPEKGYKLGDTPGFEKYLNHPDHTAPENLVTEICIPVQ